MEDLRVIKDEAELETLRRSAAITDEALGVATADGLVGRTEREVAWEIEHALREAGAEGSRRSWPPAHAVRAPTLCRVMRSFRMTLSA